MLRFSGWGMRETHRRPTWWGRPARGSEKRELPATRERIPRKVPIDVDTRKGKCKRSHRHSRAMEAPREDPCPGPQETKSQGLGERQPAIGGLPDLEQEKGPRDRAQNCSLSGWQNKDTCLRSIQSLPAWGRLSILYKPEKPTAPQEAQGSLDSHAAGLRSILYWTPENRGRAARAHQRT